jgi:hypothetical protein
MISTTRCCGEMNESESVILRKGGTNPSYEDEKDGRDPDKAVVPPCSSPSLVVEDLDAPSKQGKVQAWGKATIDEHRGAVRERDNKEGVP